MKNSWWKSRRLAVLFLFSILLIALFLTFILWNPISLINGKTTNARVTRVLQLLYTKERQTSYEVLASCWLTTSPSFAAEEFTLSDIHLQVIEHKSGYQKVRVLFNLKDSRSFSILTTAVSPLWDHKYLPDEKYILPSGRLFFEGDQLLFVFFDGKNLKLLRWDENEKFFMKAEENGYRPGLLHLWKTSFSPEDVYWSYCLVRHADFFGIAGGKVSLGELVDSEDLYREWEKLKKRELKEQ